MSSEDFINIKCLGYRYGDHTALDDFNLSIGKGEIFGFLGPNGSGKTTLFRIMATLLPIQKGKITVDGYSLNETPNEVRKRIGVVFQSPSLDGKLTVRENLIHQGHLYGFRGEKLKSRIAELIQQFQIEERLGDLVENLSGGLKRRVEIAKGLLHRPEILLLDEPSTGLDPAVRLQLWKLLADLNRSEETTILVTSHILEEMENCDILAILDRGKRVALDSPERLKNQVGGEVLTIETSEPLRLAENLQNKFQLGLFQDGNELRIETREGVLLMQKIHESFSDQLSTIRLSKPTLGDVFLKLTGHNFGSVS